MKVLFIGDFPVSVKEITEKVTENGHLSQMVTKTVIGYRPVNGWFEQWQLPKGCLGRCKSFQSVERQLFREMAREPSVQSKLTVIWGRLNSLDSVEAVQSYENEYCNGCKAASSVLKTGRTVCDVRGETCAYLRLFKAAKAALKPKAD